MYFKRLRITVLLLGLYRVAAGQSIDWEGKPGLYAVVGVPFSRTFTASGVRQPLIWTLSLSGAALPTGLRFQQDGETASITGVPETVGSVCFDLSALGPDGRGFGVRTCLSVFPPPVFQTDTLLPSGKEGTPYLQRLVVSGGEQPYSVVTFGGALPPGVSCTHDGVISGTPSAPGNYTFNVCAHGNWAGNEVFRTFFLRIASKSPPANCAEYPPDFVPFQKVHLTTAANPVGDRLVVGALADRAFDRIARVLPLPSASNQQYCEPVQLALGLQATAYVPTAQERSGHFPEFAGLLIDPLTNQPFPGGSIPVVRIDKTFAWRIVAATVMPSLGLEQPVVSAASFQPPVAVGSWISVFGANLATTTRTWRQADFEGLGGKLPTSLDGVSIQLGNSKAAAISFVSPSQINALLPADLLVGSIPWPLAIRTPLGLVSAYIDVQEVAPAWFPLGSEQRYPAALHADGTLVGKRNLLKGGVETSPARPGEIIMVYGTGFGPSDPPAKAGEILPDPLPLKYGQLIRVRIGDADGIVRHAGLVGPGLCQLNVQVPALADGDHILRADIGNRTTQREVYLSVQK